MNRISNIGFFKYVACGTMSHSKEFWGKVKLVISDYKQKIEWLERNGHLLSLQQRGDE